MAISDAIGILFSTIWLLALLYYAGLCVYNVYFHNLKDYPGPFIARASLLYSSYYHAIGRYPHLMTDLHARYGPVVRIRPNELSYTSAEAWQDIYAFRNENDDRPNFEKDESAFSRGRKIYTIINAPDHVHSRMRRLISYAFSEKALSSQESIIQSHTNQLIDQVRARSQDSTKYVVDIKSWFNWATFDVTTDLVYGESFRCVELGIEDPWISYIFNTVRIGSFLRIANRLPVFLRMPILYWIYTQIPKDASKHREIAQKRTEERLSKGITDRRDFSASLSPASTRTNQAVVDEILAHNDEDGMTNEEIITSSTNLVLAGSETTASILSGAIFYLLVNKSVMEKLLGEIRKTFKSDEEITFDSVSNLEYLNAVLQETLRIYPPVGDTLPRLISNPGYMIDGKFVSGGTIVGVQQFAAYHSPHNFKHAERFVPERWLGETQFKDDNRAVLQPFSVGPRDCMGKKLAWHEMRVILARLLLNFDLEILEQSKDWANQKIRVVWEKPALYVEVHLRK